MKHAHTVKVCMVDTMQHCHEIINSRNTNKGHPKRYRWRMTEWKIHTWKEEERPYVRRAQENVMSQQSTAEVLPISSRIQEGTDRSLFTLMLSYRHANIDLSWVISQSTTRLCVLEMLSICNSLRAALILNINFYISASAHWQTAPAPQQAFCGRSCPQSTTS